MSPTGRSTEAPEALGHLLAPLTPAEALKIGSGWAFGRRLWSREEVRTAVPEERRQELRDLWIRDLSFGVPCVEALEVIEASPRVLEIGGGSGYWSAVLRARGRCAQVICTDARGEERGRFRRLSLDAVDAMRRFRGRDVLLCYPEYDAPFPHLAALAMTPGQALYHVRPVTSEGDILGFLSLLQREFIFERSEHFWTWWGRQDLIEVWRRDDWE